MPALLVRLLLLTVTFGAGSATAQEFQQTQADDFTRYELLDPALHEFRISYDVTATAAGARYYFNSIRVGAEAIVHGAIDLASGDSLAWEVVDGAAARAAGMVNAREESRYIQVRLARPVPEDGEGRIRIVKTYRDATSYYRDGETIVFDRTLGIRRNAVVLPVGFEVAGVNYPSQVALDDDGRLRASFMNPGPGGIRFEVRGRPLPPGTRPVTMATPASPPALAAQPVPFGARTDYRVPERASQDREIVYFLQPPETHSFRLYHDYTETRAGVDRYLNIVRSGSRVSDPSATLLDTGERLDVETLRAGELAERGIEIAGEMTEETEVVVIRFPAVGAGRSARLRIWETYTDPSRYLLHGEELVWDRAFGRPRNQVVLPDGWYVTANAIPGTIDETDDGRIRLSYENARPDNIQVFVKAQRR